MWLALGPIGFAKNIHGPSGGKCFDVRKGPALATYHCHLGLLSKARRSPFHTEHNHFDLLLLRLRLLLANRAEVTWQVELKHSSR